jgi:hypothetical protein
LPTRGRIPQKLPLHGQRAIDLAAKGRGLLGLVFPDIIAEEQEFADTKLTQIVRLQAPRAERFNLFPYCGSDAKWRRIEQRLVEGRTSESGVIRIPPRARFVDGGATRTRPVP